jgi:hypothetical protein
MSLAKVRKILTSKGISFREGEDYSKNHEGSIWTWAEGEHPEYFNYYATDYKKFDCGINIKLKEQLAKVGYFAEWNDCGTIFIWKI